MQILVYDRRPPVWEKTTLIRDIKFRIVSGDLSEYDLMMTQLKLFAQESGKGVFGYFLYVNGQNSEEHYMYYFVLENNILYFL